MSGSKSLNRPLKSQVDSTVYREHHKLSFIARDYE